MSDVVIYKPSAPGQFRQGEILSNVVLVTIEPGAPIEKGKSIRTIHEVKSLAMIVSQDCDLETDHLCREDLAKYAADSKEAQKALGKVLNHMMFCEIELAEAQVAVIHKGRKSSEWERISKNNDFRVHYLQKVEATEDAAGEGLASLIVHFKRYFTVPTLDVIARVDSGETKRRCYLESPYFEHVSDRFVHYNGRIGLPKNHEDE